MNDEWTSGIVYVISSCADSRPVIERTSNDRRRLRIAFGDLTVFLTLGLQLVDEASKSAIERSGVSE